MISASPSGRGYTLASPSPTLLARRRGCGSAGGGARQPSRRRSGVHRPVVAPIGRIRPHQPASAIRGQAMASGRGASVPGSGEPRRRVDRLLIPGPRRGGRRGARGPCWRCGWGWPPSLTACGSTQIQKILQPAGRLSPGRSLEGRQHLIGSSAAGLPLRPTDLRRPSLSPLDTSGGASEPHAKIVSARQLVRRQRVSQRSIGAGAVGHVTPATRSARTGLGCHGLYSTHE